MDLKTNVEKVNDTRVKVSGEVDADTVSSALNRHYKAYANKYKFPGFRPGKAPRQIIDTAVGKETVYLDATEDVLNSAYNILVEKESLRPVGKPDFEGKDNEALVEDKKPFKFEFELEVTPVVELDSYEPVDGFLPPVEASEDDIKMQMDMYKGFAGLQEDDKLTDEIVKDKMGFESIEKMKEAVSEYVQKEKEAALPRLKEDVVSLKLRERVNVEPTEDFVDFVNDVLLNDMYQNLQRMGATFDQYLANRKMSADEFYEDVKRQAYDEAKTRMALDAWVQHFKLQATEAEIDAEFAKAGITDAKSMKKVWGETGRLWRLREAIERTKAVENAVETANFTFDEEKATHQFDELNEKADADKKKDKDDKKAEQKAAKKSTKKDDDKDE